MRYLSSVWSRARSYFLFVPLVAVYTTVLGTISLLVSVFERSGRVQHALARWWSRLIMKTILSPIEVEGVERLLPARGCLIAVNHVYALDIPLVYASLPFPFRIVAKAEVFRRAFIGWHLRRSGQIEVETSDAQASLHGLHRAAQSMKDGMPLVAFPEGGRSADGRILAFQKGVFYAAIRARVEVVPVALVGTFELLPMNTYHVRPRTLEVRVAEPISTEGYSVRDAERLAARAQSAVEELYYSRAQVCGRV